MKSILPTPQRAVTIASQFLQQSGLSVPLHCIQEVIARSRGHKSFQECVAEANATKPAVLEEVLELWCITGRQWGDDDDTMTHLWAENEEAARAAFATETLGLTRSDQEEHSGQADETEHFINSTELIGVMRSGKFELSKSLLP